MEEIDATDLQGVLRRILAQVEAENIRITQHSHQEMVEEGITIDELLEAIAVGQILENYLNTAEGLVACFTAFPVVTVPSILFVPQPSQRL